jgi:nicotinamide-nucleotide amidase
MQRLGILIIGDEIARAEVQEANAVWLSQHLLPKKAELTWQLIINDRIEDIIDGLQFLSERVNKIITSGGLGPTEDDITAEAIAKWSRLPLEKSREHNDFLKKRVGDVSPAQQKQAFIPKGAQRIESPHGTACPFLLSIHSDSGRPLKVASLPGVPSEFKWLWKQKIESYLLGEIHEVMTFSKWYTFGMPEAQLQEKCNHALSSFKKRPVLGFLITPHGVEVKLRDPDSDENKDARARLDQALSEVTYSKKDPHIENICMEMLKAKKQSIATAESCTGGWVAQRLSRIPGASEVLKGAVVAYDNQWKSKWLNVSPDIFIKEGAVSEESVKAMCEGLEQQSDADWNVAITGIAGPTGGTEEKPVGTVWLGLKQKGKATQAKKLSLYGRRVVIQRRATQAALFWLVQELR